MIGSSPHPSADDEGRAPRLSQRGASMFKSDAFSRWVPRVIWHYGLAVASVAMALAVTQSLERYTTLRTPLFYAAILITAWIGGIGSGMFAVALATLAIGYYFSPPGHTLDGKAIDLPFI